MKTLVRSRNLRLFSTSIVDQFLLSFSNFLIGFLLIRHTTDVDYGTFVLVQSAINLLIAAQSAWLLGPLMIVVPHKTPEKGLEMIGSLERSQRRRVTWLAVVALVVPLGCYLAGVWTGLQALVCVAGLLAGLVALSRDYVRNILLILSRPHTLLYADIAYFLIMSGAALYVAFGPLPAGLASVCALVLAGTGGGLAGYLMVAKDPGWHGSAAAARPFWAELRPYAIWATIGSIIYWIYSQSYNYILASRLNLTAVADVNAARLLLMPAFILTLGINSLLTPMAANWLARDGVPSMLRRIWLIIPGVMLMNLVYMAMVWFGRDLLTARLLHKIIHDREMLIVMWSVLVLVTLWREILQSAAIALGQLKSLAWLTAASAAVTLPIMWFGISYWGPVAALIGQACGEVVGVAAMLWLLPGMAKNYKRIGEATEA